MFLQPPDQSFLARRLLALHRNRSLVTAFRSPTTATASQRPPFRGRSSQPATSRPPRSAPVPVPPFGSTTTIRFAAGHGSFNAAGPLHFFHPVRLAARPASAPLRDCYLPRDQSVQLALLPTGPPDEPARFPFAPRHPSYFYSGLRITVPGPLRFRRLAVPQTSWNLLHYAPEVFFGQRFFPIIVRFSSYFISKGYNDLEGHLSALPVHKTRG